MRVTTVNALTSCIIMLFTGLFTFSVGYSIKQDVILWLGAVLLACGILASIYTFIETLVTCHIQRAFQERRHQHQHQHQHRVRVRNIDPAFVVIYMPPIRPIWPINNCNNLVFLSRQASSVIHQGRSSCDRGAGGPAVVISIPRAQ